MGKVKLRAFCGPGDDQTHGTSRPYGPTLFQLSSYPNFNYPAHQVQKRLPGGGKVTILQINKAVNYMKVKLLKD
jgi:hypothetical protein